MNDIVESIMDYKPHEAFVLKSRIDDEFLFLNFMYQVNGRTIVKYSSPILDKDDEYIKQYPFIQANIDNIESYFSFLDIANAIRNQRRFVGNFGLTNGSHRITYDENDKLVRFMGDSDPLEFYFIMTVPGHLCIKPFEIAHQTILEFQALAAPNTENG